MPTTKPPTITYEQNETDDSEVTLETIEFWKHVDPLTRLFNRSYFESKVEELNHTNLHPIGIVFGNSNCLGGINRDHGESVGDALLIEISRIFKEVSHKESIVARLSGDEFVILLPNNSNEVAASVCQEIRRACLESVHPITPDLALGYAAKENATENLHDTLKYAVENMYINKITQPNSSWHAVIKSLQTTLVEKSIETREHGERIRDLALSLGKAHGLSDRLLDELSLAALLHDIGKIGVPDAILSKKEPLTFEEWSLIKRHPEVGYNILGTLPHLQSVAACVHAHHEKWDGTGYPNGLSGHEIPLNARIITLVDSFDVMTHDRPYSKARTLEDAYKELLCCSGTHFDPTLVHTFLNLRGQCD